MKWNWRKNRLGNFQLGKGKEQVEPVRLVALYEEEKKVYMKLFIMYYIPVKSHVLPISVKDMNILYTFWPSNSNFKNLYLGDFCSILVKI